MSFNRPNLKTPAKVETATKVKFRTREILFCTSAIFILSPKTNTVKNYDTNLEEFLKSGGLKIRRKKNWKTQRGNFANDGVFRKAFSLTLQKWRKRFGLSSQTSHVSFRLLSFYIFHLEAHKAIARKKITTFCRPILHFITS